MKIVIISAIIIALVAAIGFSVSRTTMKEVEVYVTDKERVCSRDAGGAQECVYMVFTTTETFKNEDSLWFLKFHSSDVHGQIKRDTHYRFTVVGFRVRFLSWHRNIVRFEEIKGEANGTS